MTGRMEGGRDRGDDKNGRGDKGGDGMEDDKRGGRSFGRRKVCRYCADKNVHVDYKDQSALKYFVTERGKIIPRRISGNCAAHQRKIGVAVKRARMIALMPFTVTGK